MLLAIELQTNMKKSVAIGVSLIALGLFLFNLQPPLGAPAEAEFVTASENNTFRMGHSNFESAFKGDISEPNALQYRLDDKYIGFTPVGLKWDSRGNYFLSNATSTRSQGKVNIADRSGFPEPKPIWVDAIIHEKASKTSPRITSKGKVSYNNIFLPEGFVSSTTKKIDISVHTSDRKFSKLLTINSLAELGTIPNNTAFLEVVFEVETNFVIDGWDKSSRFPITKTTRLGDFSYIQQARIWDSAQVEVCEEENFETTASCETRNNREIIPSYLTKKQGKLLFVKQIPVEFLRSATYPITTDADVTYGTASTFDTGVVDKMDLVKLGDNKLAVCWGDDADTTREASCIVGTVDGTTITWGTKVQYEGDIIGANAEWSGACRLADDKWIVVFSDDNQADDGYVRVATSTGTTINGYSALVEYANTDAEWANCTGINETEFAIIYNDETNSDTGNIVACDTTTSGSGHIINSCGTAVNLAVTDYYPQDSDIDLINTDKVAAVWHGQDTFDAHLVIATNVGTAITMGTVANLTTRGVDTNTRQSNVSVGSFGAASDRVAIAYDANHGTEASRQAYTVVATVSATTPTVSSEYDFENEISFTGTAVIDENHYIIAYNDITSDDETQDSETRLCTASSTPTVETSCGNDETVSTAVTDFEEILLISRRKIAVGYSDVDDSSNGKVLVGDVTTPVITDYSHKQQITICGDGGGSGCAATTTTNGYVITATTTQATLAATSSSGRIELTAYDSANNIEKPLDIAFFNDAGDLLDYCIDTYATSTGELVVHVEVDDMSSTTAKTLDVAYGDSDNLGWENCEGTFDTGRGYLGAWNMSEDPSSTAPQILDSTANSYDGTANGTMTASDQVAGQIGGSISFDASDDYLQTPLSEMATISSTTMEYWYNTNNSAGPQLALWAGDVTGNGGGGEDEIHTGFGEPSTGLTQRINVFVETGGDDISANKVTSDTNVWHHVVARYGSLSDTNWVSGWLFFDGALDANDQNTSGAASRAGYDTNLRIGRPGTATRLWNGELDNIRIYNYFMDDMDVLTNYNMTVDSATFLTFGAEETEDAGAPVIKGVGEDVTWFIME